MTLVNIGLDELLVAACPIGDANGDGRITIDEVIAAVNRALTGCAQQGTLIRIAGGLIEGEIDGGTRRFLGIPFAAPPVGDLRWRPPAPVVPWLGVREAKQFGAACPQVASTVPSEEEDCLYLNVWTPEPAPARPLPVMVWIHGGGNTTGAATSKVVFGLGHRR